MRATLRKLLAAEASVRAAWLFGSRARDGEAAPAGSDVDVAVWFHDPPGPWGLGRLAEALGRAIGRDVDVLDLSAASPVLAMEVVRDGRLLTASNAEDDLDFRLRAIREYQDTAWLRRVQREYDRRWAEERLGGRTL